MEGIIIREMSANDLPEVIAIEDQCHAAPWTSNSFKYEITNKEAVLKVVELNEQVIGYVCVRTILDMTHLLNISVMPEFRRLGIGSMLLYGVLQTLRQLKPDQVITLEVRESNTAAKKLYRKFGFEVKGRRKGYFKKPEEDALIMKLDVALA